MIKHGAAQSDRVQGWHDWILFPKPLDAKLINLTPNTLGRFAVAWHAHNLSNVRFHLFIIAPIPRWTYSHVMPLTITILSTDVTQLESRAFANTQRRTSGCWTPRTTPEEAQGGRPVRPVVLLRFLSRTAPKALNFLVTNVLQIVQRPFSVTPAPGVSPRGMGNDTLQKHT